MSTAFANLNHAMQPRRSGVEQRRTVRDLVDMVSHITTRGRTHGVRIINLSARGLMCRTDGDLLMAERITIWLPMVKEVQADIRWIEGGRIGVEFVKPIDPRVYDAMLALIPPRRTAW